MNYETLLTENDAGVLRITLNRPERLNAWTYQMGAELSEAVTQANNDDDVVAIVITGAGRGFCAGADIQDVFKAQAEGDLPARDGQPRDWVALVRASKPMVAAINGAAIGVGLTQILPMDYLVASTSAKLSVRFVKMGLVPELASSHFLTLRMGFGKASELMLSGRTVDAEEAQHLGLVDQVTAPDALLTTATRIARGMGENPQTSLRMIKQLMTQNISESDLTAVQRREIEALQRCYTSPEHKEAISAFLEKREPDFKAARRGG
jgi:2-(1,2-epoxy-1,2-dihydrophenyl)acetyl-CoA isomerase